VQVRYKPIIPCVLRIILHGVNKLATSSVMALHRLLTVYRVNILTESGHGRTNQPLRRNTVPSIVSLGDTMRGSWKPDDYRD
jgi:hypothetical protein